MSKLATRCSVILVASGLTGLLTGCPQQTPPTNVVRPIPSTAPTGIVPTPAPSSIIVNPTPGPGGQPGQPTPTPGTSSSPGTGTNGLAISSTSLPTGVLNFNYSFGLQVAGGSGSYRWSVLSGNLPTGVNLDSTTGQIFGKPTQTGTYSFELQVIDNQRGTVARSNMFILVSDSEAGLNNLAVLTDSLPSATVDRRFSRTLEVSGGTAPFNWDISAGALPDGLSINSNTGEISGTPTLRGEETFTVRVSDGRGQSRTRTLSLTVNTTDTNMTILTSSIPMGVIGRTYHNRSACGITTDGTLKATGGAGSYRWNISKGSLPNGLSLDQTSGIISGTPTAAGNSTFTIKLEDSENNSVSKVFTVETRELVVHNFTPSSGGEDLRVVIFGEGFNNVNNVLFGGVSSTTAGFTTVAGCDQVTTSIPANARTGSLVLRNAGNAELGLSSTPFVAEDVIITEVFTSPDSSGNQFVELRNRGNASVSIAGWQMVYTATTGADVTFTLPSNVPPLAPGAVTVVNLRRDGGTTASNIYAGASSLEMRFDPTVLTKLALCKGACATTATDTNYRGYLQFGPAASDGGTLENNAVTSGLWLDNSTIDVAAMHEVLAAVDSSSTDGTANNLAHYGVNDGNAHAGLLTLNGNGEYTGYTGDTVLYFTPTSGALANQEQRIRRTVTGVGAGAEANRVRINSAVFQSQIQAANVGNGSTGNGILVDNVQTLSPRIVTPATPGSFINVITGSEGLIRTVEALSGNRIELNTVVSAAVTATNTSDGTSGNGFEVGLNDASLVTVGQPVNITVRGAGGTQFTVNRNVTASAANNVVKIDQPLATAPVSGANNGDGSVGAEITLNSAVNFQNGDLALYNGLPCADGLPCSITVGGNQFRTTTPVARLVVSDTNTGDGTSANRLEVDAITGINLNDTVLLNGASRTITGITPAFLPSKPKVELSAPLGLAVSPANTGDGTASGPIEVVSAQGFATGRRVTLNGSSYTLTAVNNTTPPTVQISGLLPGSTIVAPANTNMGDGTATAPLRLQTVTGLGINNKLRFPSQLLTRTITAINTINNTVTLDTAITGGTVAALDTAAAVGNGVATPINMTSVAGFSVNQWVKFSSTGEIRQIANIAGNQITLTAPLAAAINTGNINRLLDGEAANFVPVAGLMAPQGDLLPAVGVNDYSLNLVPKSGQFSLVPINTTPALISRVPISGSIFFAPSSGTLRKYLSIGYNTDGNNNGWDSPDFNMAAPTPGQ